MKIISATGADSNKKLYRKLKTKIANNPIKFEWLEQDEQAF